jgi:hypothetical protein
MKPVFHSKQRLERALGSWLFAEADGRDADAEVALDRMFRQLPQPRIDLTAGVFARLGMAVPARRWDLFASWQLRLVVATAWVLAASALVLLPWMWPAARSLARLDWVGEGLGDGISSVAQWLAAGLASWRLWDAVGGALARLATQPAIACMFLLGALVAAGAFGALNRLITPERSFS